MTIIHVNDKMQKDYSYELEAPMGKEFAEGFRPTATPKDMLEMGVFGGKYMTDCQDEFPDEWFENAKLSPDFYDTSINYFMVRASQSLDKWRANGWIREDDPRGWFQWYCRYYMGRRMPAYDAWQIKRWRNIKRHLTFILNRFDVMDWSRNHGSPKKRQALLHWAVRVDGTISAEELKRSFE